MPVEDVKNRNIKVPFDGIPHDDLIYLKDLDLERVDWVDIPAVGESEETLKLIKSDVYGIKGSKQATVLSYQDLPVIEGRRWSGAEARMQLRRWATDSEGKVNISKYQRGFIIRDGDADNLTSYKFPIANITPDGQMVVPFNALVAVLQRGQNNLSEETFKSVIRRHIRPYYRKVDKELPDNIAEMVKDIGDDNMPNEKGDSLAALLNREIDKKISDSMSRGDIIESMGKAAGISASTVRQILQGDSGIICPPLNRLEGFAKALDISLNSIRNAAERDGCSYNEKSIDTEALLLYSQNISNPQLRTSFLELLNTYESYDMKNSETIKSEQFQALIDRVELLETTIEKLTTQLSEEGGNTDEKGDWSDQEVAHQLAEKIQELTPLVEDGSISEEGLSLYNDLRTSLSNLIEV